MMKKELETAKELAVRAGTILLECYGEKPFVSWKEIDAPVTMADRAASKLLVGELKRLFPNDGTAEMHLQGAPADRLEKKMNGGTK